MNTPKITEGISVQVTAPIEHLGQNQKPYAGQIGKLDKILNKNSRPRYVVLFSDGVAVEFRWMQLHRVSES